MVYLLNEFIGASLLGGLLYLNFGLNPFWRLKEYQTPEAFRDSCKWLLIVVHLLVLGIVGMFIFVL